MLVVLLSLASTATLAERAALPVEPRSATSGQQKKDKHADEFLVFATVFTDRGFALPGARVRARRAGEHKVRWEAVSDRRGECAVRVPRGGEYEMTVEAKGYQPETREIDARLGNREDMVFRLQPAPGRKKK